MMTRTITLLILFYGQLIFAQNNHISFSGVLNKEQKLDSLYMYNYDGFEAAIPIKKNNFTFSSTALQRGFYELSQIGTVYLFPGCKLAISTTKEKEYAFTGIGALENRLLRKSKKQLANFFPLDTAGEFSQPVYYMDETIFLQKLNSFQAQGTLIFSDSKDSFFREYAALDLKFYGLSLLSTYNSYYGINLQKLEEADQMRDTLNPKSRNYLSTIMAQSASTHVKYMNNAGRSIVNKQLYEDWDKNQEILFKQSSWYRTALKNYFTYHPSIMKYAFANSKTTKDTSVYKKKIEIAQEKITNPFILSYFEYSFTSDLLNTSTDTILLKKYYTEYLIKASSKEYIADIKTIYFNKTAYTNSQLAPTFSFKNTTDNIVTLESLRGKFIYIDVWATWCAPCKKEIPYLKKLEEIYKQKNIQFVSISVDEREDKLKWKEFAKINHLQGIQLITDNGFETSFIEKMSITSIPRFILIDPEGKLVYADALRPSDEKLKDILDGLLK